MQSFCFKDRWVLILSTLLLVMFTISGCAGVGPRNISQGRADYNEAINKTEDEQMLLSIVKGRYGETFSLLKVSGVAANFSFGTSAGIDVGFGPSENYVGNLVPFSGGLTYEENPTISYAPVQGEMYIRQLLTPISLDFLLLIVRTGAYATSPLIVLVKRINDMKNPDFLDVPSAEPDHRFYRFVELNRKLILADVVKWVADPRKEVAFDILITGYAPGYSEQVREYLTLLGLPMSKEESEDIVFPVYFAVKSRGLDGIAISTRSTGDLIQILRAAIEVPQEHNIAGVTIKYPEMGLIGKNLRIHSSKDKPEGAAIAVRYRDYWFYINDTDLRTKVFYQMLRILWSVSIAASADARAAPVFTIPVSR